VTIWVKRRMKKSSIAKQLRSAIWPLGFVLAATVLSVASTQVQSYPTQRIQILVPFSAGTVLDTLTRVVAERFGIEFGQPVVVINRPGAAGMIAFSEAAAAQPDGHTLIAAGQSQLTIQPHLKSDLPYRVEDFTPICQLFETPFALVVGADSPIKNFHEFLSAARAKPGAIRLGHSGVAAAPHLFGTLLARAAGFQMIEVPYRALGDQIKDVIGGTIDATILSIGSFSPAGVRVIAVFNRKRSATFPDVPTASELGYVLPFRSTNGLFVRSASAPLVIERLGTACEKAFASDKFREMAARLDVNAEVLDGVSFARRLDDERREMKSLVEELGLKTP
jgi:tripartite-type tricarboxylate transporter receptor subunit TctC